VTPRGVPTVFAATAIAGFPTSAPPNSAGLSISRQWFTVAGEPFNGDRLKQGETLIAYLRVESNQALPEALITDLSPAGLEVENLNLTDASTLESLEIEGINLASRFDTTVLKHEEFRDDRFVAALEITAGSPAHVFYLIRAVSPGDFSVPPALVEDLYRPGLRSLSLSGARIRVDE
jgi:alpha-2-macroglobulin